MNILHLANTPLSNSPANIASCQNYCGHTATVLLHRKSNRNKIFVGGETWEGRTIEELVSIFEKADIIHFHNFAWTQGIFLQWPQLIAIARQKKCVIQYHSARDAHEDFAGTISDPAFNGRKMVLAQYHVRQYPECEWIVPNPLPLHEDRFRLIRKGKWSDVPPLTVSYAPSNTVLRGWDYKGYDQIMPALRSLSNHAISPDVIVDTPYQDCLNRKSWSHIGIEEFFTGSYHLSFLEYMALECLTVGHMDVQTRSALAHIVGAEAADMIPMVDVTEGWQLTEALANLANDPQWVKKRAEESRAWILEHWEVKKLMAFYERVYAAA